MSAIALANLSTTEVERPRPFIKWVGGKRSILSELTVRLPDSYSRYYEPFVGGGALFFEAQPRGAVLSDINPHLMITYRAVRDEVEQVIRFLRAHKKRHCLAYYQAARKQLSTVSKPSQIAALLIYLNKTCYNGLYRVNRNGEFNVPMGSYVDPTILHADNLRAASLALQHAKDFRTCSFDTIEPQADAFYYLDPPYHQSYASYSRGGFGDDDHRRLAQYCKTIDNAGGLFMISNSDTDFVRDLYRDFIIENVQASRNVSCKSHQRGRHSELLIRNYL